MTARLTPAVLSPPPTVPSTKCAYALGLVFIVLQCVVWLRAAILTQQLYADHLVPPFLLTYTSMSLLTLLLPSQLLRETWMMRTFARCTWSNVCPGGCSRALWAAMSTLRERLPARVRKHIPVSKEKTTATAGEELHPYHPHKDDDDTTNTNNKESVQNDNKQAKEIETQEHVTELVPASPSSVTSPDAQLATTTPDGTASPSGSVLYMSHRWHMMVALKVTPAMMGADFCFNQALLSTTVSSATVLVSTQSLFFVVLAAATQLEGFSCHKTVGVIVGVLGAALTALDDYVKEREATISNYNFNYKKYKYEYENEYEYEKRMKNKNLYDDWQDHVLVGDAAAVLAAVLYATYLLQVRTYCRAAFGRRSMSLILGYTGLFAVVLMAPMGLFLGFQSEIIQWAPKLAGLMVAKGLMDFVITDYCLFRAITLTNNATIVTFGLGLIIPMAFRADLDMEKIESVSKTAFWGALLATVGFLVVNLAPDPSKHNKGEEMGHDDNNPYAAPKCCTNDNQSNAKKQQVNKV